MNKIIKNTIYSIIGATCVQTTVLAAVQVTAVVEDFQDSAGTPLISGGVLGLLVVDRSGDGFAGSSPTNSLFDQTSISVGSLLGGDDLVIATVESSAHSPIFGDASIIVSSNSFELENGVDAGDSFAVYWFPELNSTATMLTTGNTFGIARLTDVIDDGGTPADESSVNWYLPGAGNPNIDKAENSDVGRANFIVAAVPEPSSTALLGLGGLALALRRRKN